MLSVAQESPVQPEIERLLQQSDEHAASLYPAESNHLVGSDALSATNIRFFVARWDARAVGCGAMVINQADGSAELKRMFVDPTVRGRGVARALLELIEEQACSLGLHQIMLETGVKSVEALALYQRHGCRERGPFGSYGPDPLSVFMEKKLSDR
jgi:putative acetyltransferase